MDLSRLPCGGRTTRRFDPPHPRTAADKMTAVEHAYDRAVTAVEQLAEPRWIG